MKKFPFIPAVFGCILLSATGPSFAATPVTGTSSRHSTAPLTNRERVIHILDRFTYGPEPGQIDQVAQVGWQKWFLEQLQPETIPDEALDQRLAAYPALNLTPAQLLQELPSGQIIRQIANGKRPYSSDWMVAGMEQVLVERQKEREAAKNPASAELNPPTQPLNSPVTDTNPDAAARAQAAGLAAQILALPAEARIKAVMRLPVDRRMLLAEKISEPQKSLLLNACTPREREVFLAMGGGPDAVRVADKELEQAKVLRAILSQRQLQEVMTDFWFNHFNVFIRKDADQWYTPAYERNAIRPYALGKFSDLLVATAQDPAMLYYLDNWSSVGPDSFAAEQSRGKQPRGLNENYGREVMELHTVGVNAGYTQADVTDLAKIFTGWTIDRPQDGGGPMFDQRRHQPGNQVWFGRKVKDKGYLSGRQALLWLAAQPQTAHHVCYELAQRFVADNPPEPIVDAMAKTYLRTGGDTRQILITMVNSPVFWSRQYIGNKVKTPLEFVASEFRATGADPSDPGALAGEIARMGEPLYAMQPPTGYPDASASWMNTGALVERLNFSMRLAANRFAGMRIDPERLLASSAAAHPSFQPPGQLVSYTENGSPAGDEFSSDSAQALPALEQALLGTRASHQTEQVILHQLEQTQSTGDGNSGSDLTAITALLLGSPEFQMR